MKTMYKHRTLPLKGLAATFAAILMAAGCARELVLEAPTPDQITLRVEENSSTPTKSVESSEEGSFELVLPGNISIPVTIEKDIPTRSTPVNGGNLANLWLWANLCDDGNSYIEGHDLSKSGAIWQTGHFWPGTRALSFLAVASSAANLAIDPLVTADASGQLNCEFDYEVLNGIGELAGKDAQAQEDILLGMSFNQTNPGANNSTPMTIHHALSAIRFVVGNIPYGITLKSISFSNVYGKASCSVSGEGSALTFTWSGHDVLSTYTQSYNQFMNKGDNIGGDAQTFILIPQEFATDDAQLEIGFNIQDRYYLLKKSLKSILSSGRFEADRRYTFTLGIPDEVDVSVEDDVAGNVKSNIQITNTGFGPGYIRMALVGNWVNSHDVIIAPWMPSDGEFEDWNPDWERRSDGFYYYKYIVLGGATVPAPFKKYTITTKDHDGHKLYLSVMTQIVHPSSMTIWPSRPDSWIWPITTP